MKLLVNKKFNEVQNLNKDEDLLKTDIYRHFKSQLNEMKKQGKCYGYFKYQYL